MRITLSDRDPHNSHVDEWYRGSESLLAGAAAGLVSSVVTCPLDVVKTKMQAQGGSGNTVLDTVNKIWTHEGGRGFYRGLGPTIFGYLPTWAIYFTVYDRVKRRMEGLRGKDDPVAHVVAAMTAGATGTIVTNPLWVIKTRFMTQEIKPGEERYKHTFDAVRQIYRTEGLATFYRGLLPSLIGVSHIAVQFPLYERFKLYNRPPDGSDIPSTTILLCSSGSKMIASIATYPHEVLRTRLQIQKRSREAALGPASIKAPYEGVVVTFRKIVAQEGATGLYRGMGVNLVRTVPSSALTILTYELLLRRLTASHQ